MSIFTEWQMRSEGLKKLTAVLIGSIFLLAVLSFPVLASWEGTRHITGDGIDLYFMNDKVFGHINKNPLWAIYTCASDMKGEVDVKGTIHRFDLRYQQTGEHRVRGSFGPIEIAVATIEKRQGGLIYAVLIGKRKYSFFVQYEKLEQEHMVNAIVEGEIGAGKKVRMVIDGHLCPFATAGIILIVAGSTLSF